MGTTTAAACDLRTPNKQPLRLAMNTIVALSTIIRNGKYKFTPNCHVTLHWFEQTVIFSELNLNWTW